MKPAHLAFALLLGACGGAEQSNTATESAAELSNDPKADSTQQWCHLNFSSGPLQAAIDYQMTYGKTGDENTTTATSAWLNIEGGLSESDAVHAVLVEGEYASVCGADGCGYPQQSAVKQYDLAYAGNGRFTVALDNLPLNEYADGDDSAKDYEWDFAIEVNGNWYKATNGNNIRVTPDWWGGCGQGHAL